MDLTVVVPALMRGIAQEVGVEVNELKVTPLETRPRFI